MLKNVKKEREDIVIFLNSRRISTKWEIIFTY